jgi:anti-sigma regulatory factor (Ser/Thr protein kinase)
MIKRIKVVRPQNENMGESFKSLLRLLGDVNELQPNDSVVIDLSDINFVHPFLILPLSTLAVFLKDENISVEFIYNGNCKSYLDTINFPYGFNPSETENWNEILATYSKKTYLPICAIPSKKNCEAIRETLISVFENILILQLKITGQLKQSISYLLSEAITNIVDHADVDAGFIMVQNYPSKDFLDVCIADAGNGILKTYGRFIEVTSDEQAMTQAVTGKSTKDQSVTRGYGISTSRKMLVKGLGGKYFLFSGAAFYYYSKDQELINAIDSSFRWQGTMLALRIPKVAPPNFNFYDYLE